MDTLAKEIRATGVTADYQHDSSSRTWIGEKHVSPIVLDIIANIVSMAGWNGLRSVIAKRKSERVRVKVSRRKETRSGTVEEWFELDGPGAEVAKALKELQSSTASEIAKPASAKNRPWRPCSRSRAQAKDVRCCGLSVPIRP